MLRLIYRQRRRLLFGSFFGTLALMMMVLDMGGLGVLGTYPTWILVTTLVLTSLVVATCIFAVSALLILLLPNWRMMIELTGLVTFASASMSVVFPAAYEVPLIGSFWPFILTVMIFSVIYGEVLDRFRIWVDYRSKRSFVSPKSAQELWTELVPGEAPIADHWDSMLYMLEPDPDEPDSYAVQYTHGGSVYEHQTMTYLKKDAPHFAKYHHVGEVDPKNRSLVEGTYEIEITPRDKGGCKVTFTASRNLMLHRQALALWFDDHLGDQADHLRARHLGRSDWSQSGRLRRKISQYV
ncbi:hypothetical protein GV827_06675 [Sulfitobacter sp. JBTF-M27]|uniref:SRPBCC family protein n=1 Tax=Sulfitobacter sediminilitoris TaxID=2698830 RepID=A0A6P0CCI2_9RHOB|nr:hypothetical protein [Sulfitobacter sediminilitoris]NEK22084.1 hypothetical protein [Sulfitobacter sediminilitoris]